MQNTRVRNLFSTILGAGVVAGGLVLSSCEDEFTEQDAIKAQQESLAALEAQEDSLNRIGARINYTVTVAAAGQGNTTNNGRTEAANSAEGATVTLVQGGKTYTETAGKGGVATFIGLMRGQAVVTVEAEDHTTVTYTTTLGSSGAQENNVGTLIPVFPMTVEAGATLVSGKAWAELDATNDMPEAAVGAKIRATISAETALQKYLPVKSNNYYDTPYGIVETATYDGFVQEDTVGEDGTYSLIIPNGNGADGNGFSPTVEFLPYTAKQKYVELQNGKLVTMEKDVIFGEGGTGNHIGEISNVFAEIEAPKGEAKDFAAKAQLAMQPVLINNSDILAGGSGYEMGDTFEFSAGVDDNKSVAVITVNSVDANGAITGISHDGNSAQYTEQPSYTYKAVAGGAAAGKDASFDLDFTPMYDVVIDNVGSGYWSSPEIVVVYDNPNQAGTEEDNYNFGDIAVQNGAVGVKGNKVGFPIKSTIVPTIAVNDPIARKATISKVNIDERDKTITGVNLDDEGAGYLTSPKVTFVDASGNEASAKGVATLIGSRINKIVITNRGSGFTSNINEKEHAVLAGVFTTKTTKSLKPGTSNVVNFNLGAGKLQ